MRKTIFVAIAFICGFYPLCAQDRAVITEDSFLVYGQGVQEQVRLSVIEPISIYATVKGDDIIGFSLGGGAHGSALRNNVLITFSSIELTLDDFNTFRSALEKALEWDSVARQNDVDRFSKDIPFTISSNNVSWATFDPSINHTIKKGETLTLKFIFSWTPSYIESRRSALHIDSNTINTSVSGSSVTFRFRKDDMHLAEIELFLESITDEKIKDAIKNGRIQQIEDEARKKRTETLFN
jgi:hypothetical protein